MKKPADAVRVLTWNIHGGVGPDRRFDLHRIVDLIRDWEVDIIALQEVDSRRSPRGSSAFSFLLQSLGGHGVEAKSILARDGEYGQMLISRWAPDHTEIHDISVPRREPRRAIHTGISTPYGLLQVTATHLGLSFRERRWQSTKLCSIAGRSTATSVIMGDFNDWLRGGAVKRSLTGFMPEATSFRTWPARCPMMKLDQIFCRPAGTLIQSRIDHRGATMSDHLPVIADLRVFQ
ncbi:endonuclease/exonuclease/phosphatase family protein [Flaviflagellibacter deserti]|uniref:Endonuclease/exonuclease/phosphatase family protein n=1 Tax=Flaviflagellibacter deserti TaxID=2267266 RepID=A0ABV9Z1K4_9HYPH